MEQTDLFLKDLKLRCLQHKIDLVEVDINKGIEQILISYLKKDKKCFEYKKNILVLHPFFKVW